MATVELILRGWKQWTRLKIGNGEHGSNLAYIVVNRNVSPRDGGIIKGGNGDMCL